MKTNGSWFTATWVAIFIVSLLVVGGLELLAASGETQIKINLLDGRWSDPSIWKDGRVPASGDKVTIREGTQVVYDLMSEAEIAELNIEGALKFSRYVNTNLDVGDVYVRTEGYMEIGTESQPIPRGVKATVRFVNSTDGEHALYVMGEAQIHGQPLSYVYTTLAQDADRGSAVLHLQDSVDWKPGDHIVITSTTQDPTQSEEAYIAKVTGRTITLNAPLKYHHDGREPAQAQVALLTRNVVITSKNPELRGHTRFLEGAKGSISYAEFSHLGAEGELGKYPIHFHMAGDTMRGSYVKGVSVWDSGNRFITVHSTQYVTLSYNVGYNAVGHGFFLEIGDEVYVIMEYNLGIMVTPGKILASDRRPAVFWIQNPVNTLTGNIAVSSTNGSGFEFAIGEGEHEIPALGGKVTPRKLPLLMFDENEAHSNAKFGVRVYRFNTAEDGVSELLGLKVWRNRKGGLHLVGSRMTVSGALLFGNRMVNVALTGNNNLLEKSTILGELAAVASQPKVHPPSTKGLVIGGKDNTVADTQFKGHVSRRGITGSDISLNQSHERPVRALVVNSVMASSRPIIFGYPLHEESQLEIRNNQRVEGDDFLLVRMDVTPPLDCEGGKIETSLLARKCPALEDAPSIGEQR